MLVITLYIIYYIFIKKIKVSTILPPKTPLKPRLSQCHNLSQPFFSRSSRQNFSVPPYPSSYLTWEHLTYILLLGNIPKHRSSLFKMCTTQKHPERLGQLGQPLFSRCFLIGSVPTCPNLSPTVPTFVSTITVFFIT